MSSEEELRQWARARARQLRSLYLHVGIYVVVMLGLLAINAMTRDGAGSYMYGRHMYHHGGGDWWVVWPALGWGIAVAIHAVVVLTGGTTRIAGWEDRKVEELIQREKNRAGV